MIKIDNRIFNLGDYSIIEVYNRVREIYLYVFVDTEDVELIKNTAERIAIRIDWKTNYCKIRRKDNGEFQQLHRLIMNTPKGLVVDHINHNGLDNRKINFAIRII